MHILGIPRVFWDDKLTVSNYMNALAKRDRNQTQLVQQTTRCLEIESLYEMFISVDKK